MASANPVRTFDKDPTAVLDYTIDWSDFLNGDTISAAPTWVVPAGISSVGQVYSQTTTTIWLSGGTAGTSYSITATIVTTGGRTDTRTIQINVVSR